MDTKYPITTRIATKNGSPHLNITGAINHNQYF